MPHPDACHVATTINPMATREGTSCSQVKAGIGDSQSQQGLKVHGPHNSINTPNSGPYPPLGLQFYFVTFILFDLFYFFPFINY